MIDRLDHVLVLVRDLDETTKRTAALLGRLPSWRGIHPEGGTANALFRLGNTYLELLSPVSSVGAGALLGERLEGEGEGFLGMAFGCADADDAVAGLRRSGVEVSDPRPGSGRDEATGAMRHWRNAFLTPAASRGPLVFVIEHRSPPEALALHAPDGPGGVTRLDHAVVMSSDLEASRALYGDALGLRLALDRPFPARGIRILFFRVGGTTVEVVGRLDATPEATPDRLHGLAWQVEDAEVARRRLAAAGFEVSDVRDGAKRGTRVFTVADAPAGVPTLVIQPVAS